VNEASAVGVVLTMALVLLVFGQRHLLRGRNYATVTGKGFRPNVIRLGKLRWVAFGGVLTYITLAVVLPILALALAAVQASLYVPNVMELLNPARYSLDSFARVFNNNVFVDSIKNSLLVGVGVAIFGILFHFSLAYYIRRTRVPGRLLAHQMAMLPAAVPALVLGLGMLWAWTVSPIPLYGTLAILVVAYVARFTPQGFEGIASSLSQVHEDLEAAAQMAGASKLRAVSWVTVPLIRTSIVSTGLLLFLLSMRELSTSIFLYTAKTRVTSVVIFQSAEGGQWQEVASMSLVYSAILLAVTLLGRRWLNPA